MASKSGAGWRGPNATREADSVPPTKRRFAQSARLRLPASTFARRRASADKGGRGAEKKPGLATGLLIVCTDLRLTLSGGLVGHRGIVAGLIGLVGITFSVAFTLGG